MDRWAPWLYVYGLGGAVFFAGLAVAFRRGARPTRRLLVVLLVGLGLFAGLHAVLQAAGAPGPEPATGHARGASGFVGTPLDAAVVVVYFVAILSLGAFFARYTRTTGDFFFGGRRYAAWLVAMSTVATTVGAYSFVKYASAGFRFGLSSTMSYLNDWFWMPLWMLVWLPIVYYGRIQSIPEYFERRFGRPARVAATVILLVYLVGYVGINFLTLGKAVSALTGWPVLAAAAGAALATGLYVAAGGQTSVIMTDLAQGGLLLLVGLGLFAVGVTHVGGLAGFWASLPGAHRMGLAPLTHPPAFHTAGVFWQDAMANGVAFFFLNQGIMMRFMSARSVREGRRAMVYVILLVMPLAALAVSGVGWVGRAMVDQGLLDAATDPDNVFVLVSAKLATPGIFGLVMATLTAALMSTADTLLTAVSAVFVNDVWRPWLAADPADDAAALRTARWSTVLTAGVGVVLVPVFLGFGSIYTAHATFVSAVVPPMAVALVLGFAWPRFGPRGAVVTLVGGAVLIAASMIWPALVAPFAPGIPPSGEGLHAYKFMRAAYGLGAGTILAVVSTLVLDRRPRPDPLLVAGPEAAAQRRFKGAPVKTPGARIRLRLAPVEDAPRRAEGGDEILVALHPEDRIHLGADPGDLVHLAALGRWHGGLKSLHARVDRTDAPRAGEVPLPRALLRSTGLADGEVVTVELEG